MKESLEENKFKRKLLTAKFGKIFIGLWTSTLSSNSVPKRANRFCSETIFKHKQGWWCLRQLGNILAKPCTFTVENIKKKLYFKISYQSSQYGYHFNDTWF